MTEKYDIDARNENFGARTMRFTLINGDGTFVDYYRHYQQSQSNGSLKPGVSTVSPG